MYITVCLNTGLYVSPSLKNALILIPNLFVNLIKMEKIPWL